MIKFSILVPAYNAERYILENIESIVSQSYNNWEIIIVNDGSTDGTKEIVEAYVNTHLKYDIKLISVPNGGLANARNLAYKAATGEYFCNLDSDDFLEPGILEEVAKTLSSNNYDIVYYDIIEYDETTKSKINYSNGFFKPDTVLSGIDAAIMKLKRKIWICQGVAFYNREFIRNIDLHNNPGVNQGEDMYFITSALSYAGSVKYINYPGASIRYRSDSMMHMGFNESYLQCITAIDLLKHTIEQLNVSDNKKDELLILIDRERIYQELRIAKSICDSWGSNNIFFETLSLLKKYSDIISPMSVSVRRTMSKSHLLQYYLNRYTPSLFILLTKLYRLFK